MADIGGENAVAQVDDGAVAQVQPAAAQNDGWSVVKTLIKRVLIIYLISSLVRQFFGSQSPKPAANLTTTDSSGRRVAAPVGPSKNIFSRFEEFDLYMYLSESEEPVSDFESADLFWKEEGLVYGDWKAGPNGDGSFEFARRMTSPPAALLRNGSLFLHLYVVKGGSSPDPKSRAFLKRYTIYQSRRLNKFKKKRYQKTQNLLTGETDASDDHKRKVKEEIKSEILSHWHPNLTINIIDDHTTWTRGSLPPPLDEYVKFDPVTNDYYPIVFFNDYWNLGADYQPLNETVTELNLTITYSPMSLFKWQLYASQQMKSRWSQIMGGDLMGDAGDDDQDSVKQALLETNPYLLGITVAVSLLHTVFEFLAFKNDIQFWRSRKTLEGLSVRSILFNVFTSLIVLLYVMDHDTNFVVKVSVGIGLLIELWKVPKCMNVAVDNQNRIFGLLPRLRITDKGSYVESSTKVYDELAFRYLGCLLFPLLGGYAVYSLLYLEHSGWYSWVLGMLYGFLLTFGFIMMTPQLFINYKLKSVAHLPWRMLSYKFINTFIDDLFAFVIRMPTMYRLGCFRDDIVFLVYVYQRWIYPIDPARVNEFGTSGLDEQGQPALQPSPAAAAAEQPNGGGVGEGNGSAADSSRSQSDNGDWDVVQPEEASAEDKKTK